MAGRLWSQPCCWWRVPWGGSFWALDPWDSENLILLDFYIPRVPTILGCESHSQAGLASFRCWIFAAFLLSCWFLFRINFLANTWRFPIDAWRELVLLFGFRQISFRSDCQCCQTPHDPAVPHLFPRHPSAKLENRGAAPRHQQFRAHDTAFSSLKLGKRTLS